MTQRLGKCDQRRHVDVESSDLLKVPYLLVSFRISRGWAWLVWGRVSWSRIHGLFRGIRLHLLRERERVDSETDMDFWGGAEQSTGHRKFANLLGGFLGLPLPLVLQGSLGQRLVSSRTRFEVLWWFFFVLADSQESVVPNHTAIHFRYSHHVRESILFLGPSSMPQHLW